MNVAVMGTGLMGRPLAERLQASGYSVTAFNRTRAKAEPLHAVGVTVAERPEDAVRAVDCVILLLADVHAIRSVLCPEPVARELAGRTIIQMGTIGPGESRVLGDELRHFGTAYLEAPVLGSVAEVRDGALTVMVGASPDQFARWSALFHCLSKEPRLIGPVGTAAALKLALNQLIAAETAAFALSLGLAQRAGVSVDTFMGVLRQSPLFAPQFEKKLPRMLRRDFGSPNFSARHLLKDVTLCLEEARRLGLDTASLEGLPAVLRKAIDAGYGEMDYSVLYEAVNPPTLPDYGIYCPR